MLDDDVKAAIEYARKDQVDLGRDMDTAKILARAAEYLKFMRDNSNPPFYVRGPSGLTQKVYVEIPSHFDVPFGADP